MTNPIVVPILDTIEKRANADAQLAFGSVSMMRRFSGVAKAIERKEKTV
jgi:hypothetical protein